MSSLRIVRRATTTIMPSVGLLQRGGPASATTHGGIAAAASAARKIISLPPQQAAVLSSFIMPATHKTVAAAPQLILSSHPMVLLMGASYRHVSTIGKSPNGPQEPPTLPQTTTRSFTQVTVSYDETLPLVNVDGSPTTPQQKDQQRRQDPVKVTIPLDDVHALPHDFHHLSHEVLFHLAKHHVHGACRERLIREIMRVDGVSWESAYDKVEIMNIKNDEHSWLVTAPDKFGFTCGILAALSCLPLVFDLQTVLWFNENWVHEDLPEGGAAALDTIWKVGAFSWGYMEPYIGTLSFMLLGLQFSRAQMQKVSQKPYTELLLSYRANRLARLYPQYNRSIVREFSKSDPWGHLMMENGTAVVCLLIEEQLLLGGLLSKETGTPRKDTMLL